LLLSTIQMGFMCMSTKIAKYEAIKRHIRELIRSGKLREGDRVPSEYELVGQLGVGRSHARQALRELEIEGYLIRRQGSGSFVAPNPGGGALQVTDAPRTVAVAFPTYDTAYMRQVVEGFMETLFAGGYGVTNYNLRLDEEGEVRFLESVLDSGLAGLMIWLGNETNRVRQVLQNLEAQRFPVVLVDRYFPDVDMDWVVSDNEEIGYALTKALIDRGHQRIGVAFSGLDLATSQASRIAGYERAMGEANLPLDETLRVTVDVNDGSLSAAVNAAMAPRNHPTAFTCINDIIGSVLHREFQHLGYGVPEHVELAVVDDTGSPGEQAPKVLALRQNGIGIGRRAADLMLSRLTDFDRSAQHVLVPPGKVAETALSSCESLLASGERTEARRGGS